MKQLKMLKKIAVAALALTLLILTLLPVAASGAVTPLRRGSSGAQVRESQQEGVGALAARGRAGLAQQQGAKRVGAKAKALAQAVEGFQGEGGAQRLGGAFERAGGEQAVEKAAEGGRVNAVARQRGAKPNAESAPAAALAPAPGAIDALAAGQARARRAEALAAEAAVAVERAGFFAVRAKVLF